MPASSTRPLTRRGSAHSSSTRTSLAAAWARAPYRPTPTIVEAARALYAQHSVEAIARFDAGTRNLRLTSNRIDEIVDATMLRRQKAICFITGVPGAGKTLELPADRIMFADMDVIGSCSYPTSAWSGVVRLLEHGLVDFEPIVTHRFPADRFEEAFAVLEDRTGTVAKVLLEHVPAS